MNDEQQAREGCRVQLLHGIFDSYNEMIGVHDTGKSRTSTTKGTGNVMEMDE